MSYGALTYIGNCEWEPLSEPEYFNPPNELPRKTEVWIGCIDKLDDFLATYYRGYQYLGGYVIDRKPSSNDPFPGMAKVELTIGLEPDFQSYWKDNTTAIRTASKSATPNGTIDDSGNFQTSTDKCNASRTASYYAPQTKYEYFASSEPKSNRFNTVSSDKQPEIIKSEIKVSANNKELTFGGNAPVNLVSALYMPSYDRCAETNATQIIGTPWYKCVDLVTRDLQGDS